MAVAGFVLLLTSSIAAVALTGFILIGLGAANIAPVLYRCAGSQTVMPPGLAIAAITITGYAGILMGPVSIGFVAKAMGLNVAFWLLAALLCLVLLMSGIVAPHRNASNMGAMHTRKLKMHLEELIIGGDTLQPQNR